MISISVTTTKTRIIFKSLHLFTFDRHLSCNRQFIFLTSVYRQICSVMSTSIPIKCKKYRISLSKKKISTRSGKMSQKIPVISSSWFHAFRMSHDNTASNHWNNMLLVGLKPAPCWIPPAQKLYYFLLLRAGIDIYKCQSQSLPLVGFPAKELFQSFKLSIKRWYFARSVKLFIGTFLCVNVRILDKRYFEEIIWNFKVFL